MNQPPTARLLVIDDDHTFRVTTAALLRQDGHDVSVASDGKEGVALLRQSRYDLVLLDVRLPETSGLQIVEALRLWGEDIPILMISGFGTVDIAVQALHLGADDFLTKPVEPEVLSARVADLLERRPGAAVANGGEFAGMIGRSPAMREVFASVERLAHSEATVLITGETGTGKELVAKAIHNASRRKGAPFVGLNCASLAEGLLESELFGHVRGAFTGAVADKTGVFEAARNGTLFLDEIVDMSPALQQRLLRVLQEREIRRVGSVKSVAIDVRIIAASQRDLRREVSEGRFREDLFYRLNVFNIALPPLRERAGDIPLLVDFALRKLRGSGPRLTCSPLAMRMLRGYKWPGNVRELFAALESAMIRSDGTRIEANNLPEEVRSALERDSAALERYRGLPAAEDERSTILAALEEAGGSRSRAAEILGMGRTTLWRKLKQYQ